MHRVAMAELIQTKFITSNSLGECSNIKWYLN